MSDQNNDLIIADEAAALLRERGFDDATVQQFHAAAAAGDTEALRRRWFARELRPLPNGELRPLFLTGVFPEPAPPRGLGGAVLDGATLVRKMRERDELFSAYGSEAAIAAAPRLGEPIL